MQKTTRVISIISAAMLTSVAVPLFAESAPVFEVDSVQQQQFNAANEQSEANYPLPPSPSPSSSSAQEGAFVPANPSTPTTHAPATSSMSLTQRLHRVEQELANVQGSESQERVESLQGQVQSLRGQVEQLLHQVEQLQSQQKAMYSDLDKRIDPATEKPAKQTLASSSGGTETNADSKPAVKSDAKISTTKQGAKATAGANGAAMAAETKPAKSAEGQPDVAEEQKIYQTAYNLIKAKKYNEAVDALQGMLKKYPSGQFASNAHYWLGELYGLMGKNDQALIEFATVVSSYPESPRVSDAQLKVGLIYSAQSKWADAKSSFKKVMTTYPGTASARVASEQLKQIKSAGH